MLRSYFFIKAIQLRIWLASLYYDTWDQLQNLHAHIRSYFQGDHHTWLFITGHTLPLPVSHIKNEINASWKYSNHALTSLSQPANAVYKLSWLSARICVVEQHHEKEYDIDSFLSSFRVHTHGSVVPTLTFLFLSWCAETNQWFRPDCIVQFHIIDHLGQNVMLTLRADNHSLEIREQKIYHRIVLQHDDDIPNAYTFYHA